MSRAFPVGFGLRGGVATKKKHDFAEKAGIRKTSGKHIGFPIGNGVDQVAQADLVKMSRALPLGFGLRAEVATKKNAILQKRPEPGKLMENILVFQ